MNFCGAFMCDRVLLTGWEDCLEFEKIKNQRRRRVSKRVRRELMYIFQGPMNVVPITMNHSSADRLASKKIPD